MHTLREAVVRLFPTPRAAGSVNYGKRELTAGVGDRGGRKRIQVRRAPYSCCCCHHERSEQGNIQCKICCKGTAGYPMIRGDKCFVISAVPTPRWTQYIMIFPLVTGLLSPALDPEKRRHEALRPPGAAQLSPITVLYHAKLHSDTLRSRPSVNVEDERLLPLTFPPSASFKRPQRDPALGIYQPLHSSCCGSGSSGGLHSSPIKLMVPHSRDFCDVVLSISCYTNIRLHSDQY